MKKPVVDYRQFRLSKLKDPQFSHLNLLWGWVAYLIMFMLTENLIPAEKCTPVHCFIDDIVPFCEVFVIPYVLWYLLIAVTLVYFALYNIDGFRGFQKFIITTQVIAMVAYIVFPTRQDLRPEMFPRDNFLTDIVGGLYAVDTNTGVCPSLHVGYSLGIASVWLKEKTAHPLWKVFIVVMVILICLSTMFIKQHSAVDFFAALPMCAVAEWIAFGKSYYRRLNPGPSADTEKAKTQAEVK